MSYGSAYIQPKLPIGGNSKSPRSHRRDVRDRNVRLIQYEKEFNVKLSRVELRDRSFRDSMLAYSEKMSTLSDARAGLGVGGNKRDPLFVRAKRIPKYPQRPTKKRRPMSFDELIGRDRDTHHTPHAAKQRPHSDKIKPSHDAGRRRGDELSLPALSDRLRTTGKTVHVSLVSASDLYEYVDFSLKNKGTRQDSINLLRMERHNIAANEVHVPRLQLDDSQVDNTYMAGVHYEKYERTSHRTRNEKPDVGEYEDSNVRAESIYQRVSRTDDAYKHLSKDGRLPNIFKDVGPFRGRPKRVKRMQLQNPGLGDIPEDNIATIRDISDKVTDRRAVCSPPPPRQSPRTLSPITTLPDIEEDSIPGASEREAGRGEERENSPDCTDSLPANEEPRRTRRILMRDDGEVRIEVTQCPPKAEPINAKLKAQKKIKKLIFLRDLSKN